MFSLYKLNQGPKGTLALLIYRNELGVQVLFNKRLQWLSTYDFDCYFYDFSNHHYKQLISLDKLDGKFDDKTRLMVMRIVGKPEQF